MSSNVWLREEQLNKISPLPPNKPCGVPRAVRDHLLPATRLSLVGRACRIRPRQDALQLLQALVRGRHF